MAAVAGYSTVITLDNAAGSPVDVSAYANSISGLDLLTDMLESTAFGNTSKAVNPGLKGGASVTIAGDGGTTMWTQLSAIHELTTGASQTLKVQMAGAGSGLPYVSVETFLTSMSDSSDVGGKWTYSASLQMTGNVTTGTN
jgi:hypothetical protein